MFAGGTITYAATPMEDGLLRRLQPKGHAARRNDPRPLPSQLTLMGAMLEPRLISANALSSV